MLYRPTIVLGALLMLLGSLAHGDVKTSPATAPATRKTPPPAPQKAPPKLAAALPTKYTIPTPAQIKARDEWREQQQEKAEALLKIKLKTFETAHFHIITDWDPREYQFLKDHIEAAYAAVSGHFGIPASENIFVGKLPCFVFNSYGTFEKFSSSVGVKVERGVQAFYWGNNQGYGYMVMQKPTAEYAGKDIEDRKMLWKYVVTHELTHAFVARYISNRHVVTWLNEGIAEVIASSRFQSDVMSKARSSARKYKSLDKLFAEDDEFRSADLYPVMQTLTEVLIKKDKKAFLKMFDEIKQGKTAEEALKDNYNLTYPQLEALWRRYVGG